MRAAGFAWQLFCLALPLFVVFLAFRNLAEKQHSCLPKKLVNKFISYHKDCIFTSNPSVLPNFSTSDFY